MRMCVLTSLLQNNNTKNYSKANSVLCQFMLLSIVLSKGKLYEETKKIEPFTVNAIAVFLWRW